MVRTAPLPASLFTAAALALAPAPAQAATTYRLGVGVQASYNSALVQPVARLGESTGTVDALMLSVRPFALVRTETGRISQELRYDFLADGILVPRGPLPAFSYQNALHSTTRLDLTAKLVWNAHVSGAQGRLNSFTQLQSAGNQAIEAPNLLAQEFLSLTAGSQLLWDASARLRLSQPVSFRAYIPYGTISRQGVDGGDVEQINVTGALQSYTLDGGLGLDYEWARAQLGGEVRVGWFLPQRGVGQRQTSAFSLVTGQALLRAAAELAPRWRGEVRVGVYVATQADNFLRGRVIVGEGPTIRVAQATLTTPIGGASLSYVFPQSDANLVLSYLHGAAGEVFIGRLSVSDAVTLRANVPLPKNFAISASVGYRRAELLSARTLSRTEYRLNPLTMADEAVAIGQSYHLMLADASLSWAVREDVNLYARYAFQYQEVDDLPPDDSLLGLQDFDRHLALVGVALYWPRR